MKKIILTVFAFFITFLSVSAHDSGAEFIQGYVGIIQSVEYVDIQDKNIGQAEQRAIIKLTEGENKGASVVAQNIITGNPYYDINLKKGMKVTLHAEDTDDGVVFSVEDVHRSGILVVLSLLFIGLLVYVGKKKGLYSLVSIFLTCVLIYNLLSPMILHGIDPIIGAIIVCVLSTALTMYLVGGFNKKSTSATLGCISSIIFAGILSFLTVKLAYLTGFTDESSLYLFSSHPELSYTGILIAAMLLATLGAVMDVAMSIASTINEIYTVDNTKTVRELFTCGMNVGRDIIGTMANTLILVYLGSSLTLLLLANNIDMQKFINLNQVVTEISSALIGSCAIVICVPLTAIIASNLVRNSGSKDVELLENFDKKESI